MNRRNLADKAIGFIGAAALLAAALIIGAAVIDLVQGVRSEAAQIECATKGLEGARQTFRSAVTCVPRAGHGVDSLVVKGVTP